MPATVQVDVFHGAGPSASAWTANGRYHKADTDPTTDASTTPVQIPGAGTNYSWRKSHKLNVTVAPSGSISNLQWYGPGADVATGVKMYGHKTATYTQAASGDETALISGGLDLASNYTSGAPLTINSGIVLTATTGYGTQDYVETQLAVDNTATLGTYTGYTMTYKWLET